MKDKPIFYTKEQELDWEFKRAMVSMQKEFFKRMAEEDKEQRRYPRAFVSLDISCIGPVAPFDEAVKAIPEPVWEKLNKLIVKELKPYINMQGDVSIGRSSGLGIGERWEAIRERKYEK